MKTYEIHLSDDDAFAAVLVKHGATEKSPYHVPGPYEIALTVGAALAASGNYQTPGAALAAAWMAVPEFYMARDQYLTALAPVVYGQGEASDERAEA